MFYSKLDNYSEKIPFVLQDICLKKMFENTNSETLEISLPTQKYIKNLFYLLL